VNPWYPIRFSLSEKPNPQILTEESRRRARIAVSHWEATLDQIEDQLPYKKFIKGYISNMHDHVAQAGAGLLLHGPVGSGKTALGSIVLREALARGGRVLSVTATELIDNEASKHPLILPNGAPISVAMRHVSYLLIDDLDPSEDARWHKKRLPEVVKARLDNFLPVIITTNSRIEELKTINWFDSYKEKYLFEVPVRGMNFRRA